MKKNIMQNMASKYKKFQYVILCAFLSLATFGCMTRSRNADDRMNQEPKIEAIASNESADFVEGLVPPQNQNILLPYYVQAGDNLAKIAKKIYGNFSAWKKIAEINKIVDPNKIYAGDVIYYQLDDKSKMFAEKYENAPRAKILVKKGDTLSHISRAVFGRSKDWRVLWKENPHIKNPDKIREGASIYFRPKALTADAGENKPIIEPLNKPIEDMKMTESNNVTPEKNNPEQNKSDLSAANEKINNEVKKDATKPELTEEEKNIIKQSSDENYVNPDDIPKNPKDD